MDAPNKTAAGDSLAGGHAAFTPARAAGFAVLVAQQAAGRYARESNCTDTNAGYVYWQTARWLVEQDLAYFPSGSTWLALTAKGRERASAG